MTVINEGKFFGILISLSCILLQSFAQEKVFPIPAVGSKQLFYLQRTSNTNTIVYELNYKNGIIDTENPVQGFWIRYQEKGQREELNFIQRKFAYGLKAKKIAENQYELNFVPYNKYKMYLKLGPDKKFYVYTTIKQNPAILTSIFIKINGGSLWSPAIEYVEISGIELNSRSIIKERLKI